MPRTRRGLVTRASRPPEAKTEIIQPYLGLHSGIPPQALPPGFTPEARNFVGYEGFITPRSGVSQADPFVFNSYVIGAREAYDSGGSVAAFAASNVSFAYVHPSTALWSELSFCTSDLNGNAITDPPSGTTKDYWDSASIYDAGRDEVIIVASNSTNYMKWFSVNSSPATFSDFTWVNSLDSMKACAAVNAINDRLVLFNVLSSVGTRFPNRVAWSARGQAKDFLLADGAGFEDLVSMRGSGTASVRYQNFLILFTDQEIWRAQPTLDDYAFRFERVSGDVGCPWPRTAVATPAGVMFLGRDFEVYSTDGVRVVPLGPVGAQGPSRIQREISTSIINPLTAWSLYNQVDRRYELYYTTEESLSGFPNRSLWFHLDDNSWWPQIYSQEFSYGVEVEDTGDLLSWDEMVGSWGVNAAGWDTFGGVQEARWINLFSSDGTIFKARSNYTLDDASAIDARWRSHALRQRDSMRRSHLNEVWMHYEAASASSASVFGGGLSGSVTFDSSAALSLTTAGVPAFAPLWSTSNAPIFEVRINDGSQPRIASFQANFKDGGRF